MNSIIFILLSLSFLWALYALIPAIILKRYVTYTSPVIHELVRVSGVRVRVVIKRDASVNAFSLPNNVIVITEGLANQGQDNLRSALAHEVGHLKGFHHVKTFLLLTCLTGISIFLIMNVNIIVGIVLMLIGIIIMRYTSRLFEFWADKYAVSLVGKSQYIQLLTLNMDPKERSTMFSTHPTIMNRLKKI
ncbi:M48 family metalloprotease [Metallosphaera hakonensis]|uniref:Peptidase M48 n=1 Tax=Metallosphaera hakonensis JCM 8857 = DSM 7519 TaxID=1293036 RepID=A0A2U9ITE3_9CREN|nr:M48 family metalloprotease [Metallosphaera hakonensis]AWR99306.1 M48 family metalloprotease [Metallosphaera hakonensis JCM 8857 = DSM 7519]